MTPVAHHHVSHPYCSMALSLLAGLTEVACSTSPSATDGTLHSTGLFENMSYTTHMHVESCMDDNPSPPPSCM